MINQVVRNYIIKETLGRGSFGVVYKAINQNDKKSYVLKQISLAGMDKSQIEEVKQEATILSSLNSEYIVKYYESFVEGINLNIIMEFCDGGDLSKFLDLQKLKKKYILEDKIWRYFVQICLGLAFIHKKNILHRDLKTMNIFLTKEETVRIGDLGVAKILSSQTQFAKTFVGTPYYLSPEMCEEKPYNEKSDIWALGCILYEMITYRHPFEANNPASLCIKILTTQFDPIPREFSSDLKFILDLLLEKNYVKRPSITELLNNPILIKVSRRLKIDITAFTELNSASLDSFSSKIDVKLRQSEKMKIKDLSPGKKDVSKKSIQFKKNSPYYNHDFVARKEIANQRDRNPKKPSGQARFAKIVSNKKSQPLKLISKCEPAQKIKEVNQKLIEFENKLDNEKKRPCTSNNPINSKAVINKNEKKRPFTPKNINVIINPNQKQDKDIKLVISTPQQFQDTLYFLKNDKSDDTGFFKHIMPNDEYDKIFKNKKPEEIRNIREIVLQSLKKEDIKEDEYEELPSDSKSNNLIFKDTVSEEIDIITEFYNDLDDEDLKNNFNTKKENISYKKDPIIKENIFKNEKKIVDTYISKPSECADVVDEIQHEVDNFKITNFLNEDCKFKINLNDNDSTEGKNDNNDESYDSTIENTDYKEDNECDEEFKDEVKIVVDNSTNCDQISKKDEQAKRIKECIEKIEFYKGRCIDLIGEKRFSELYNHYYSLNDKQRSDYISKEKEFTDVAFVCYFLQLLHYEHQKKL